MEGLGRGPVAQGLMGPEPVVEPEVVFQPPLGIEDAGVGFQVHLFILHRPPQPLHEAVVGVSPLPSMLIFTPRSWSTWVNSRLVSRLNPDRDFDFWLKQYNNFLPSAQTRWCTRQLKLRPFEQWIRPSLDDGDTVYSYVAIRADEEYREGYSSTHDNLIVRLPLKDAGIDKSGVLDILEGAGLGLPRYYEWRTRSGCTFCFFQQKIEWVRLMERHPGYFEEAKSYEKNAIDHGSPFTWSQGESLDQLSRPERVAQIKEEHQLRLDRMRGKRLVNPLRPDAEPIDIDGPLRAV